MIGGIIVPMRVALVVAALIFAGCTERNPAFCGDGTCIDPARPYCDLDGHIGGTPGTCIAVECTPESFFECRSDSAIVCNSLGNNYDEVQCPLGCTSDSMGCKECTSNDQCGDSVCDPLSSHCRACATDDECDSAVCDRDTGRCVAESSIVYAAPMASGNCTRSQPCRLETAIVAARNATPTAIVRLLPGNYVNSLSVTGSTNLQFVATGANIVVVGDTPAVVVDNGANVDIRNLTSTSERFIGCGLASTSAPISTVSIRESTYTGIASGTELETQRCKLTLTNVELFPSSTVVGYRDDSTITFDRVHVRGSDAHSFQGVGSRVNVEVVNSVFEGTDFTFLYTDPNGPATRIRFVHDTFLLSSPTHLCSNTGSPVPGFLISFENSIAVTKFGGNAFAAPNTNNCSFAKLMLAQQTSPLPGMEVADPQFVDLAGRDFRLKSSSPAIDAAVSGSINPTTDIIGVSRPQGPASDLGAYEFKP